MRFSLFEITIKKGFKELAALTISFYPKENGSRHLFCIRKERSDKKELFVIHWLFNWTHIWTKEYV